MASARIDSIVGSASGRIAAVGCDGVVQVWDLRRYLISRFESVYLLAGQRLALDPAGKLCAAGAWDKGRRGGVVCHDAESGGIVWHRRDLGHIQFLEFRNSSQSLWCGRNEGPLLELSAASGETLNQISGYRQVRESSVGRELLLITAGRGYQIRRDGSLKKGPKDFRIPSETFALLDSAFAPDAVCTSEAGGAVRCTSLRDRLEFWRFSPPSGSHVVNLAYRRTSDDFWGINSGLPAPLYNQLIRFDRETGRANPVRSLPVWKGAFVIEQGKLVLTNGDVIDLETGRDEESFAFVGGEAMVS